MKPAKGEKMETELANFVDYETWRKVTLMPGITSAQHGKMVSINRKIEAVYTGGGGGLPRDWVTVCYVGGFVMGIDPDGRGSS
tara:strand:+ start:1459 stop:1707 length:249 start_codon:yes stop_codon:yes gene_type:complete